MSREFLLECSEEGYIYIDQSEIVAIETLQEKDSIGVICGSVYVYLRSGSRIKLITGDSTRFSESCYAKSLAKSLGDIVTSSKDENSLGRDIYRFR